MKKIFLLLLLTVSISMMAQEVSVNSIYELRQLPDQAAVSYLVTMPDTVYATTDGRLCLSDGTIILTEGLEEAKAGMTLVGQLRGMKSSKGGYPLLQVNEATSSYKLSGAESVWYTFNLDEYEKAMGSQKEGPVEEEQPPYDNVKGIPTVSSIMAFRQLENGTEARLQLHRDTILFVGNGDAYLRGNAAICLRGTGLDLKVGLILRGTLIGIKGEQDGIPLLLPSEHTSSDYYLTDYSSWIEDHYLDFSDLDPSVGDVVTVEDVVIDSLSGTDGVRRLYVCKGNEQLPIVDLYAFCRQSLTVPARCASMKAVLSVGNGSMQLFPVSSLGTLLEPLSIRQVETHSTASPLVDLQGRRINGQQQKGLYIRKGKKYMK